MMARRDKILYGAAVAVGLLAAALPVAARFAGRADGPAAASALAAGPPVLPDQPVIDPLAYKEIVDRPLFVRDRRPAVVATAEPQAAAPPPPALSLLGVMVLGDERVALLKRDTGGATLSVRKNDSVDGWAVDAIEAEAVVLRVGTARQTIGFPAPGKAR